MKSHTSVVTFFSTSIGVRRADQQGSATFVPKLIVSEAGAIELNLFSRTSRSGFYVAATVCCRPTDAA